MLEAVPRLSPHIVLVVDISVTLRFSRFLKLLLGLEAGLVPHTVVLSDEDDINQASCKLLHVLGELVLPRDSAARSGVLRVGGHALKAVQ